MAEPANALIQQLEATEDGDPWYGSARATLLTGLTPHQAAERPIAGGHSVWQLLHMTSWTNEVRRRLAGQPPSEALEGDWPAVEEVSVDAWDAARRGLEEAHSSLMAAVKALPPARWTDPVGPTREPALGTGVSVAGMLVGLAQHDAYHTGQVVLLRRATGLL